MLNLILLYQRLFKIVYGSNYNLRHITLSSLILSILVHPHYHHLSIHHITLRKLSALEDA